LPVLLESLSATKNNSSIYANYSFCGKNGSYFITRKKDLFLIINRGFELGSSSAYYRFEPVPRGSSKQFAISCVNKRFSMQKKEVKER